MLNLTTRKRYRTLLDGEVWGKSTPEAPAIIYLETGAEPITVTRRQLRERVGRYAAALRRLDVGSGDLVIVAHTQNLESIYLFWAAIWVGAVPSMFPTLTEKLDPVVYRRNMAVLVARAEVKLVLTTDAFAPELQAVVTVPVLGSSALQASGAGPILPSADPEPTSIAFLQHSSGTTGLQKGVALSHTAVLNQIAAYSDTLALNAEDVIVSWLPLYHDMGLIAGFLLPLLQGIPLVLMSPFDWVRHPALLLRGIDAFRGTLCWLPNFAYNHLARRVRRRDREAYRLDSMRAFINCSEPVRAASHTLFLQRYRAQGVRADQLAVSYAMAENTFAVTQTPVGQPARVVYFDQQVLQEDEMAQPISAAMDAARAHVSCGLPLPACEIRVVNKGGAELEPGRVGEITLRSDSLLTAYYRREDLRPFTPTGWYRTGDRGFLYDGELFVIGRSKDLIINAGKNIYPQDIEAIVHDVPGVRPGRAVVFGVPDLREGTELLALLAERAPNYRGDAQELKKEIRLQVARQSMVQLTYVELVPEKWLLKTTSGKLARGANREKWLAASGRSELL